MVECLFTWQRSYDLLSSVSGVGLESRHAPIRILDDLLFVELGVRVEVSGFCVEGFGDTAQHEENKAAQA